MEGEGLVRLVCLDSSWCRLSISGGWSRSPVHGQGRGVGGRETFIRLIYALVFGG